MNSFLLTFWIIMLWHFEGLNFGTLNKLFLRIWKFLTSKTRLYPRISCLVLGHAPRVWDRYPGMPEGMGKALWPWEGGLWPWEGSPWPPSHSHSHFFFLLSYSPSSSYSLCFYLWIDLCIVGLGFVCCELWVESCEFCA